MTPYDKPKEIPPERIAVQATILEREEFSEDRRALAAAAEN